MMSVFFFFEKAFFYTPKAMSAVPQLSTPSETESKIGLTMQPLHQMEFGIINVHFRRKTNRENPLRKKLDVRQ